MSFTAETLPRRGSEVTHVFVLTVLDNDGLWSVADEVTITVAPQPKLLAPIADAGPDLTVESGSVVTIDASESYDPDGDVEEYVWFWHRGEHRIYGQDFFTTGADTAMPTFTADILASGDADVEHVLELYVKDNDNIRSARDFVTVTITAPALPVANAGPDRRVSNNSTVRL